MCPCVCVCLWTGKAQGGVCVCLWTGKAQSVCVYLWTGEAQGVCVCVCVDRGGRGEVWEGIGMGPGHHTNPDPRCQCLSQQDRTQES